MTIGVVGFLRDVGRREARVRRLDAVLASVGVCADARSCTALAMAGTAVAFARRLRADPQSVHVHELGELSVLRARRRCSCRSRSCPSGSSPCRSAIFISWSADLLRASLKPAPVHELRGAASAWSCSSARVSFLARQRGLCRSCFGACAATVSSRRCERRRPSWCTRFRAGHRGLPGDLHLAQLAARLDAAGDRAGLLLRADRAAGRRRAVGVLPARRQRARRRRADRRLLAQHDDGRALGRHAAAARREPDEPGRRVRGARRVSRGRRLAERSRRALHRRPAVRPAPPVAARARRRAAHRSSSRSPSYCFGTFLAGVVFRFREIEQRSSCNVGVRGADGGLRRQRPAVVLPDCARVDLALPAADERPARRSAACIARRAPWSWIIAAHTGADCSSSRRFGRPRACDLGRMRAGQSTVQLGSPRDAGSRSTTATTQRSSWSTTCSSTAAPAVDEESSATQAFRRTRSRHEPLIPR